ncbi:uncharacterized protein LOC103720089 [Phoenix dactylifera]|uniref:Uncharacterized protein LOC103720089 n=1 Tax=Phoenix dactylifera TaxID=42345 RepID=A0A8B8ZM58_PHODC|nr:uncharacterized protein LOC103720089 [Phoenix dactylifera]XP_038972560.1 uncharacterized protein LOC103720089 [Phoenix dactylifera]
MKSKASTFLKQVFSAIVSMVKAKSMAVKSKASAMKSRLLIFGLLRHRRLLMSAINHKIHALMGQEKEGGSPTNTEDRSKAIVLYNAGKNEDPPSTMYTEAVSCEDGYDDDDDDDDYPDLTHSLFDDEDEDDGLGDATGSVIDLVRNSKEDGSEFRLEDEIDHVADVFIRRFRRQMRMQKLESFKRYQEMLERSV